MPTMSPQPNILLIVADQWRGDCLGCSGHAAVQTPHLDQMFYHGVRFDRAYSAVPTCIAARAALMTGLSPQSHGRVGYADNIPWTYPITLPRLLADAGYHTQCVGKMHVTPERSLLGFHNVILHDGDLLKHTASQNYDRFDDYRRFLRSQTHAEARVDDTGCHVNSWVVNPWPYPERLHPTNWVTTEAIDFLRRRDPGKPFFLNVSYVRPHPPYDPPPAYLARYDGIPLPPIPVGDWCERFLAPGGALKTQWTRGPVSSDALDLARRAYFALITQIDFQVSRLFMALAEHGVIDNTVVIFLSDHGELLGDHHFHSKAMPFEGSARIPCIMQFPPRWKLGGQQVIHAPVELRDILPTICECAGIPIPPSIEGESVLRLIRDKNAAWREVIHGEHSRDALESNHWVTNGHDKYIWFSQTGHELLFNLDSDPLEMTNLSEVRQDNTAKWRRVLIQHLKNRPERFVESDQLVPGRPHLPLLQQKSEISKT